jgi:WD40 repeat protein
MGSLQFRLDNYFGGLDQIQFAANDKLLVAVRHAVVVWDMPSGKRLREIALPTIDPPEESQWPYPVARGMAVSSDGKLIAIGISRSRPWSLDGSSFAPGPTLYEYALCSGRKPATYRPLSIVRSATEAVVFMPDNRALIASDNFGRISILDVSTGRDVQPELSNIPRPSARTMALSADGRFLASSGGIGPIGIVDVRKWTRVRAFGEHEASIAVITISADGAMIAELTGRKDDVKLWDARSGKFLRELRGNVECVTFSHAGSLLATAGPDGISVWDASTGKRLRAWGSSAEPSLAIAFTSDDRILATLGCLRARLWDARTGDEMRARPGHGLFLEAAAFSPDGSIVATATRDGNVRLWEPATGKELASFPTIADVESLAFSRDGKTLFVGARQEVVLWDIADRKARFRFPPIDAPAAELASHPAFCMATSSDGKWLATGGTGSKLRIWNAGTWAPRPWDPAIPQVFAVAISPDSKLLAAGWSTDPAMWRGKMGVWELVSGKQLRQWDVETVVGGSPSLPTPFYMHSSLCISGESAQLAWIAPNARIRLWDTTNGVERLVGTPMSKAFAMNVAFLSHGRVLASGGLDGTISFWDTKNGELLRQLKGGEGYVDPLAVCENRGILVSGEANGTALVWRIPKFQIPGVHRATDGKIGPDGKN